MAASFSHRRVVAVASLLLGLSLVGAAQTPKPPPRLPPTPSQTSQIPSGIDTGSSASSDSLPLGTPVMTMGSGDKSALKGGSAAARAAARPKPAASSVDCTRTVVPSTSDPKVADLPKPGVLGKVTAPPPAAKNPVAPGSTRLDCDRAH
jgi:hypothetical protein